MYLSVEPQSAPREPRSAAWASRAVPAVAMALLLGLVLYAALRPDPASGGEPLMEQSTATAAEACPDGVGEKTRPRGALKGPGFRLSVSCVLVVGPGEVGALSDLLGRTLELREEERLVLVHLDVERWSERPERGPEIRTDIDLGDGSWSLGLPEDDAYFAMETWGDPTAAITLYICDRPQRLHLLRGA